MRRVSPALFLPFLAAGFGIALLHVAIPTHWLPFVLVGRAQGWRLDRVLSAAGFAAAGHILTTTAVGVFVLLLGRIVEQWLQGILHYAAAALLFGFGVFYVARALQQRAAFAGSAAGLSSVPVGGNDRTAFWGLVATLAISPGEVLLSFYLTGDAHGWPGLALLSLVFFVGTFAGMALLITLAWEGLARFRIDRLARYESAILGVALLAIGVAVMVFRT
jgi:hypothetical protein